MQYKGTDDMRVITGPARGRVLRTLECEDAIHVLLRCPAAPADTGSSLAAGGGNIAAVSVITPFVDFTAKIETPGRG